MSQTFTVDEYQNKKMGRYLTLTRELRFHDFFRFLSSVMNALASNLQKKKLLNLKKVYLK